TGTIAAGDSNYFKMFVQSDYEGTFPKSNDEIAVQSDFINKNNLDWKVGDIVSVPCGIRTFSDESGSTELTGTYMFSEEFEQKEVKQFKVTAILNQNNPTSSFPILTGLTDKNYSAVAFQLKKIDKNSLNVVNEIFEKAKPGYQKANTELLYSKFAYGKGSIVATLMPLVIFVLIIIMAASVVLIYNAFAMSLSEKVKYLGMLSSVGATKKQKQLSIYYEGFILALFGIPVGIGAGVLGIGITLKAIGKKIISTGMIMGVTDENVHMQVKFPIWALLIVLALSIITIFISSSIPARKASKISTISAIRQSDEFKVKPKSLKSPKYIKHIFGYEGELAYKNLKRNGRKARVITVSIALSIVLFLSCNYFCDIFTDEIQEQNMPYQVSCYLDYDKKDDAIKEISAVDKIDEMYCASYNFYSLDSKNSYRKDFKQFWQSKYLTNAYKGAFDKALNVQVNLLDDDMFNELCQRNGIDSKKYYNGKSCNALLMNNVSHSKTGKKVFNDNVLGTKFKEIYTEDKNLNYEITDFVSYSNTKACNLNRQGIVSLYVPYSNYIKVCNNLKTDTEKPYLLAIETTDHKYVTEKLNEISDEGTYGDFSVTDYSDQLQTLETVSFIIQVFVYGFIALISLITVFNIINTISSGIASRKKEFAMFKSVGITPKGFNKMIMLESAFYGIKAVLVGLPLSALLSFGMYYAVGSTMSAFTINLPLYLAVVLVVFAIIGATMLYSVKKVQENNIIETLKEDIN
ncbi:MAG: FtsX-like permease family protein, partial [Clostridia bacterium]|nr:FtsX-like permease family protein [Clostridia bacterium]